MLLTERHCLHDLVRGLESACPCGKSSSPWAISSVVQVNFYTKSFILTSDKAVCDFGHTRHSSYNLFCYVMFKLLPIFNIPESTNFQCRNRHS